MNEGAKLVAATLLGKESKTVVVEGKPYFIKPLKIRQIAGIGYALSGEGGDTISDILAAMRDSEKAAEALSWAIAGNDTLTETFKDAPLDQVVNAIATAISTIGIEDFQKLSDLKRSVLHLIANPK